MSEYQCYDISKTNRGRNNRLAFGGGEKDATPDKPVSAAGSNIKQVVIFQQCLGDDRRNYKGSQRGQPDDQIWGRRVNFKIRHDVIPVVSVRKICGLMCHEYIIS